MKINAKDDYKTRVFKILYNNSNNLGIKKAEKELVKLIEEEIRKALRSGGLILSSPIDVYRYEQEVKEYLNGKHYTQRKEVSKAKNRQ